MYNNCLCNLRLPALRSHSFVHIAGFCCKVGGVGRSQIQAVTVLVHAHLLIYVILGQAILLGLETGRFFPQEKCTISSTKMPGILRKNPVHISDISNTVITYDNEP